MAVRNWLIAFGAFLVLGAGAAQASVTLLLEEPYGNFGGLTPTGHASIYLSRVCAASPISLRRCRPGEQGVVISRYHRVGGYDWIAVPALPYLYAVDRPGEVPTSVTPAEVAALRDRYRRINLEAVAPDAASGRTPNGDWTQLVGAAYDRTIYAFGIETTEQQDDQFIRKFNSGKNREHFNLLFHNCADFVRQAVDFYYPHAIHRSLMLDAGIMTPKQYKLNEARQGQLLTDGVIGRSSDVRFKLPSYELGEQIGAGGMGTVYKAVHTWLGRTVAVKFIAKRGARRSRSGRALRA